MPDCPVCGKPIDPATAPTSIHRGVTYYLRCPHCKERFDADPERFLRPGPRGGHDGCGDQGGCAMHHRPAPIQLVPPRS